VLGEDMINSVVINTVTVMLFVYGKHHNEQRYKDKALEWMIQLPAENNSAIRKFKQAGIQTKTARDSQSLIELKTQYCDEKRCLDCAVANHLLRGKRQQQNDEASP
jgi:hypothetical protein